jgi:hypothetical protein
MSSAPTAAQLISVGGERTTGASVRTQNGKPKDLSFAVVVFLLLVITLFCVILCVVMAVSAIANIVKSSLGPVGLDKMLVDDVGVSIFCQECRVKVFGLKTDVQILLELSFCTFVNC